MSKKPTLEEVIKISETFLDAEVPMDDRVMYFYKISWYRHPIKRFKQIRQLRRILETSTKEE